MRACSFRASFLSVSPSFVFAQSLLDAPPRLRHALWCLPPAEPWHITYPQIDIHADGPLPPFRAVRGSTRRTGARRTMVEKANDIVERLRKEANGVTVNLTNPWPTMREAADAIALCH